MDQPSRKIWTMVLSVLVIFGLLTGALLPFSVINKAQAGTQTGKITPDYVKGPFTSQSAAPTVFNGDLRDLPQLPASGGSELPEPGKIKPADQGQTEASSSWVDPVA